MEHLLLLCGENSHCGDIPCEDIPDDDALIDELIELVDNTCPRAADIYFKSGPSVFSALPPEPEQKRPPGKKVWRIISTILFYGLLAALITGAFFISQGDKRPIFGYSFMNVITWSMEPEIPQGSLVVIRKVDPGTIRIGDDITYMKDAETSVTHRVIGITEDFGGSGERGFETQGIDNEKPDFDIVPAVNVAGKVVWHTAKVGDWLAWLRGHLLLVGGFGAGTILLLILLKGAFRKGPEEDKKKSRRARAAPKAA